VAPFKKYDESLPPGATPGGCYLFVEYGISGNSPPLSLCA
jgi:hypothetical protein